MHQDLYQRLLDAFDRVPIASTYEGRNTLLEGIPPHLVRGFYRSPSNTHIDLINLFKQLEQLGTLEPDGVHPLILFLENAQRTVVGTLPGRILNDLIKELKQQDEEDVFPLAPSTSSLPETPEVLIFGGSDERLPYTFFEGALRVQQSIVRLRVPRIFDSHCDRKHGVGTGWLITPQLVLTNYHVVAARLADEPAATSEEFQAQAEQTVAWFDYHTEEETYTPWSCINLVWKNAKLDYTLLRLDCHSQLTYRPPLSLAQRSELHQADRLNIVQHSNGKQLRYAVRNNFYIGIGETLDFIRYLTDTEEGASGSPVFNDNWLVVAMHHLAKKIPRQSYKGETIKYHNEGIEIHSILKDMPADIRQEIIIAQGWETDHGDRN